MTQLTKPFRILLILGIGVLLGVGLSVGRSVKAEREIAVEPESPAAAARPVPWQDARLLAEVLEHVRKEYVDRVSDQELIEAAIRGLVADLDPHSAFLDSKEFDELRMSTAGEYSGVGIEVSLEGGVVKVISPMEGGPAERAGVRAGDTILAVDDEPVDVKNVNDSIERMRGKAGSKVKITIARSETPEPLHFTLARGSVQVRSVKQKLLEPGLGYVSISHFSETTAPDLQKAIASLTKESKSNLRGLVLDLRNNPGGLLEAAIGVSDIFLNDGVIVSANGRAADARFEMDAKPGDDLNGAPIIVLVNGGSASASEIVAGALKDHHRATIVGQQTYGKGSVQTVVPLSDGHAIKLTTSRYFTPSGASIQKTGITPDVVVDKKDIEAHGNPDAPGDLAADYEVRLALGMLKDDASKDGVVRNAAHQPVQSQLP